jgi:hypothetical protein
MRQAHQRWWSQYRGGFGLRKTARLLLHLLGLLGDFLGRLGSLLCFLRFFCHVFLVGLVGLTNVRTLRTSARAIKLTRNQQKLYHVRLTCVFERCSLTIMSSADVPPTRGLRDISDGGDDAPRFVDSHRWPLELDLLGDI